METEEGKERGAKYNEICKNKQEFSDYAKILGEEI